MKDYTETEYEKKSFIMRYIIDIDTKEIKIIYADNIVQTIPYSVKNEIRILNQMKKQVEYYSDFVTRAKDKRRLFRFKKAVSLVAASIGTVFLTSLSAASISLGTSGIFYLPYITMNVLMIAAIKRKFNEIDDSIYEINEELKDYNKSMFYIQNEKIFANERIQRRDVISNVPDKVQSYIEERNMYGLDEEVPSINLNNLEDISMKEIKKTYEASLQSHGPELVLKPNGKKK